MNKDECIEVVERIHLSWNQTINPVNKKLIYRSWWRLIGDLDVQVVHKVVDRLAVEAGYMPRPGEIRRRAINIIHGVTIPTPIEAWQQLREAADASMSGAYAGKPIHELVSKTIKALGGTQAYTLHTNGDREQFLGEYARIVSEYEETLYGMPDQEWTPLGSPKGD